VLVCIDGIYDIGQAYTASLGLGADTERRLTADTDPEIDAALAKLMHTSSQVRWACRQGMWSFGVRTPRAYLAASLAYTLRDGIAEKITCPVFVGRGESDQFFLGQPEELMQHLTAPATLGNFTDAEGAGAHCQVGAQRLLSARMFDWLDETLAGSGPGPHPAVHNHPATGVSERSDHAEEELNHGLRMPPDRDRSHSRKVRRSPAGMRTGVTESGPAWTEQWFNGHGLYRLRGTVRYPKAA
jgi:hypothetical protein